MGGGRCEVITDLQDSGPCIGMSFLLQWGRVSRRVRAALQMRATVTSTAPRLWLGERGRMLPTSGCILVEELTGPVEPLGDVGMSGRQPQGKPGAHACPLPGAT